MILSHTKYDVFHTLAGMTVKRVLNCILYGLKNVFKSLKELMN